MKSLNLFDSINTLKFRMLKNYQIRSLPLLSICAWKISSRILFSSYWCSFWLKISNSRLFSTIFSIFEELKDFILEIPIIFFFTSSFKMFFVCKILYNFLYLSLYFTLNLSDSSWRSFFTCKISKYFWVVGTFVGETVLMNHLL